MVEENATVNTTGEVSERDENLNCRFTEWGLSPGMSEAEY